MTEAESGSITRKSFVVGYFGAGNAGDAAICQTINRELFRRGHEVRVGVIDDSLVPNGDFESVELSVKTVLMSMLWADTLVVAGGTHFHDYDGRYFRRWLVFLRFLGVSFLAKSLRMRLLFVGHGVGPLQRYEFRRLLAVIVRLSDWFSVRDKDSYAYYRGQNNETGALAFDVTGMYLRDRKPVWPVEGFSSESVTLGISVTAAQSVYFDAPETDREIISQIATEVERARASGYIDTVKIYVFNTGTENSDYEISRRLGEKLSIETDIIPYSGDPELFLDRVAESDVFLGMRYHSSVFAYLNAVPFLVLPYHPKCRYFANHVGCGELATLDPTARNDDRLKDRLRLFDEEPSRLLPTRDHSDALRLTRRNFSPIQEVPP